MNCFNVNRRFRIVTNKNGSKSKKPLSFRSDSHLDDLDDRMLSYLAESVARELIERGYLHEPAGQGLSNCEVKLEARKIPAVSIGPSGICGDYQKEL